MDWGSLGGGAGAGFISAILTILGLNRRVTRLEDLKQDKAVCDEKWRLVIKISEDVDYMRKRFDDFINKAKR